MCGVSLMMLFAGRNSFLNDAPGTIYSGCSFASFDICVLRDGLAGLQSWVPHLHKERA